MHNIQSGVKASETIVVTPETAISFLGAEGPRVLSTPQMISFMERTCRNLILPMLDAGYDTLGSKVNISHLAAAPLGASVTFKAEIVRVAEKRVEFRVEAWNGVEKLGDGAHERAIIHVSRFAAKLAEKSLGS